MQSLLQQCAVHLQALTLKYSLENLGTLSPLSLPSLAHLTLGEPNFSVQSLYNLLINSKKLDFVELSECPQFKEELMPEVLKKIISQAERFYYAYPEYNYEQKAINQDSESSASTIRPFSTQATSINAKLSWDANTTNEKKPLQAKIHFFPLNEIKPEEAYPVNHYRLQTFNNLNIAGTCTLDHAFTLFNEGDLKHQNRSELIVKEAEFKQAQAKASDEEGAKVLGVHECIIGPEWVALPSLNPDEKITHLCTNPADAQVELCYSERDNLYHIRSKNTAYIRLNYLLQMPPPVVQALPEEIEQLQQKYLNYQEGPLELKGELTGSSILHALQTQNKGACRHRAIAFKEELRQKYPQYPSRIISNEVHAFVEVCINNQWIKCDLGGYEAPLRLDNSLEKQSTEIAPLELLQKVDELNPISMALPLVPEVAVNPLYEKRFATWEAESESLDVKAYCQKQLQNTAHKKRLIEVDSESGLQGLYGAFYQYAKSTSRPVFCINSPEDLICSSAYMRLDPKTNKGSLVQGPGGPLYEFLRTPYQKDNPPVLLVNYDAFDAYDLVRFNALLDNKAKADGIDLPMETLVVGFLNTKNPKAQYGSDFISRFDIKSAASFSPEHFASFIPGPFDEYRGKEEVFSINLFQDPEWKERLLGHWVINGTEQYFEKGPLIRALSTNKPILIENGPWELPEFQQFWQQLRLGQSIPQPMGAEDLKIKKLPPFFRSEGYNWDLLLNSLQWDEVMKPGALTLNPGQLNLFFQVYECDNQTLNLLPGYLQQHASTSADKTLHINLSRTLSDNEWAEFLSKAQKLNLTLHLHCAPAVSLPQYFQKNKLKNQASVFAKPWHDRSIVSTDLDTSIAQLELTEKEALILDISECDESDLLIQIRGTINQDNLKFEFEKQEGVLFKALNEGKTVVLKGSFSTELQDALANLMLSRRDQDQSPLGRLILLSETALYSFMPTEHQVIKKEEKLKFLTPIHQQAKALLSEAQLAVEPLAKLKARLSYLKRHPNESSDKAWEGFYNLPTKFSFNSLDLKKSKQQAHDFTKKRLEAVQSVLSEQPFAFLTGLTGVGKTTFVTKYLSQKGKLYQGETLIKEWALDKKTHLKILFIDEANLSPKLWSMMEGLFNKPPGILIDGIYYPLDEHHKVVFAGNPVSYGDDRILSPFFSLHGNAVLFEPLPLACIYEDILLPLFDQTPLLASEASQLCQPILESYQFLCRDAAEEVPISPRELQAMALLIIAYCDKYPKQDAQKVAAYYAYHLTKPLVPKALQANFKAKFKEPELLRPVKNVPSEYLITPSRLLVKNLLEDLLVLREFKGASSIRPLSKLAAESEVRGDTERRTGVYTPVHEDSSTVSTKQFTSAVEFTKRSIEAYQYGGLGGIILEGEPGVGKSELVTHILIQNEYQEVHSPYNQAPIPEKAFYRMPVSLGLEEKEKLLLKAFHEGAVVIIDEINSSPMMERLLNSLLMGSTPEGGRAKKPGFMIIGTQNPITMAGRMAASTALSRRIIKVELASYTTEEMCSILISKGLKQAQAMELIHAFNKQVKFAQDKGLSPAPCFRDLLKAADELNPARKAVLQAKNSKVPMQDSLLTLTDFDIRKNEIQQQFTKHLNELNKKILNSTDSKKNKNQMVIFKTLFEAQKEFFIQLTPALNKEQLNEHITQFRNLCQKNIKATDKIMGHGWLYRLCEVLIKAVVGLFLGIGMVLGSLVGQGLAKSKHRQAFKNTFFTLNQTKESKALKDFEKNILGESKEDNSGLISTQNLKNK